MSGDATRNAPGAGGAVAEGTGGPAPERRHPQPDPRAFAAALAEQVETHRRLYNRALAERKTAYLTARRTLTYGDQSAGLRAQRAGDPSLARANFSACQRTLKRLDQAFVAFFRRLEAGGQPGYPRFKGRHRLDTVEYTHPNG
jgi:putative transposase